MTGGARWTLSIRTRLTLWYSAVLVAILVVISALSYSMLRWSLLQDVDSSLMTVAHVIRDTGYAAAAAEHGTSSAEATLRDILGPEFYDKIFQLADPEGRPGARSAHLHGVTLPLSPKARVNAAHGLRTYETLRLGGDAVRLLTIPVVRDGTVTHLVQVGMSLDRAHRALDRYLETLLILVPFGIVLAATGGAWIARAALRPVDEMSRTARWISGEDLSRRIVPRGTGDELDRLAGTLNQMLARLEEAFTAMRRFAADAAHELRTPLTALKGGIEVALRSERSTADYRRVLASSLEEVDRLIRIAEDLLLLSRFSSGVAPARARVELEPLAVDVLDVGARLGAARGVTVRLREATAATVVGDGAALRRAVLNLVDNAVKYTPTGGKVEIALERVDGQARITVTDAGPGIAADDLEKIFQPFVRLEAARMVDAGGSGLGLAIARSIVVSHGGTLTATSAPGAGSTFVIALPLAEA